MCITTGHTSSFHRLLFALNSANQLAWWLQLGAGWPLIVQFTLWFPTPCVLSLSQIFIFDGAGWKQQRLETPVFKVHSKLIEMGTEMRGKRRHLSKHGGGKHSEHLLRVSSSARTFRIVVAWYFKRKSRLYDFHSDITQNSVCVPQV